MTLPADISRCQGSARLQGEDITCPKREDCERYLALMDATEPRSVVSWARMLCVRRGGMLDETFPSFIPAFESK